MDNLPYGEIGRLDYDPIDDTLLCHLCGRRWRNLAQHARLAHGVDAGEYRELAGLNHSTRLFAPGLRQRLSEVTKPRIAKLRARGKLRRWDEDPEKLAQCKAAASDVLREGLSPEGRRRARERWTPDARQQRAEQTRQRNLAGELRADPAAIGAGVRRYYAEHPEAVQVERLRRQAQTLKEQGMPRRMVACERCGQAFETGCTRARYCPTCRPIVNREYQRLYKRESRSKK